MKDMQCTPKKSTAIFVVPILLAAVLSACALPFLHKGMDMATEKVTGGNMTSMGCCAIRPGFGIPATVTHFALPETSRSLLMLIFGLVMLAVTVARKTLLSTVRDRNIHFRRISIESLLRHVEEGAFKRALRRGVAQLRLYESAFVLN